jgi:hypothetical protein
MSGAFFCAAHAIVWCGVGWDELAHARMAWREFQSTRERDAVYAFLSAVFEIVQRWKNERRAKAGSLQAHDGIVNDPEIKAEASDLAVGPLVRPS